MELSPEPSGRAGRVRKTYITKKYNAVESSKDTISDLPTKLLTNLLNASKAQNLGFQRNNRLLDKGDFNLNKVFQCQTKTISH